MKYSKLIIAVIVALIFIGTFVFLYQKSQPEPVVYNEFTTKMGDVSKTTLITGKIEPRNEVNVKPQISGIITDIYKEAGDIVKAGEVIAKVKVIPDMSQLSSAESRVRLAEINAKQAQVDYDRDKVLFDKHLITAESFDKVSQTLHQAQEEVKAANDALEVVRDGVSKSNASASSTLIRSTISGVILDIPVKVGNTVILSNTFNDGTTIATLANMKDEYISPKAVENNGANQFEIKAAIDVKGAKELRSGYSANAEIVLQTAKNVLTIPESAVEFNGDSTFVYLVKGKGEQKTYERHPVTIGISDGVNIEIKKGLSSKDVVRGPQVVADTKDKE